VRNPFDLSELYTEKGLKSTSILANRMKKEVKDFLAASSAASVAVTLTNPLDLLKTKLQLQAELNRGALHFSSFGQLLKKIWRLEGGPLAFQRGLSAALAYQISMNGSRFPIYTSLKQKFNIEGTFCKNMAFGAVAGAFGAFVGSPFNLIRIRMQAFSKSSCLPTGDQHNYSNLFRGLKEIHSKNGFSALYRNAHIFIARTSFGSCCQLACYDAAKGFMKDILQGLSLHLAASNVAGFANSLVICPLDFTITRMQNQSFKGKYYSGFMDCIIKTVKNEGFFSLYRGFVPLFLRLGPHSMLTFVFYEYFVRLLQPL
jgi:solute carrier family 25 protein 34/35